MGTLLSHRRKQIYKYLIKHRFYQIFYLYPFITKVHFFTFEISFQSFITDGLECSSPNIYFPITKLCQNKVIPRKLMYINSWWNERSCQRTIPLVITHVSAAMMWPSKFISACNQKIWDRGYVIVRTRPILEIFVSQLRSLWINGFPTCFTPFGWIHFFVMCSINDNTNLPNHLCKYSRHPRFTTGI